MAIHMCHFAPKFTFLDSHQVELYHKIYLTNVAEHKYNLSPGAMVLSSTCYFFISSMDFVFGHNETLYS